MLKGLDPLLGADLLHTLALMGHGDELALVDRNYPAASTAGGTVIRLPGVDLVTAGRAILSVLPLDTFEAPLARMQVVDRPDAMPDVQAEFLAAASEIDGRALTYEDLERHAFYARCRTTFATVSTGEDRPYGCVLLRKGVIFG
ncbi:MAG: fucose-binding protein [Frankiales bacterium]|nr:fucose-binding protein [Frankiales bacterium]